MFGFRENGQHVSHFEGEMSLSPLLPELSPDELAHRERVAEIVRNISPETMSKILGTPEEWAEAWKQAGLPETFEVDPGPEIYWL